MTPLPPPNGLLPFLSSAPARIVPPRLTRFSYSLNSDRWLAARQAVPGVAGRSAAWRGVAWRGVALAVHGYAAAVSGSSMCLGVGVRRTALRHPIILPKAPRCCVAHQRRETGGLWSPLALSVSVALTELLRREEERQMQSPIRAHHFPVSIAEPSLYAAAVGEGGRAGRTVASKYEPPQHQKHACVCIRTSCKISGRINHRALTAQHRVTTVTVTAGLGWARLARLARWSGPRFAHFVTDTRVGSGRLGMSVGRAGGRRSHGSRIAVSSAAAARLVGRARSASLSPQPAASLLPAWSVPFLWLRVTSPAAAALGPQPLHCQIK